MLLHWKQSSGSDATYESLLSGRGYLIIVARLLFTAFFPLYMKVVRYSFF